MKYYPMPVIIVSAAGQAGGVIALKALELGAVEVIAKPDSELSITNMTEQLAHKIRVASTVNPLRINKPIMKAEAAKPAHDILIKSGNRIIAIGASTGGTEAIKEILTNLPPDMPPILIVQHMPQFFTKSFAERLNGLSSLHVKEAEDGDLLAPGKVLLAPGGFHMALHKKGSDFCVEVKDDPAVFHQKPSVEVLFESIAKLAGANAIGVILTGMGRDGAGGLLKMREFGAFTIAQDEESCIVYGMPREAVALGAVCSILPLQKIAHELIAKCKT